MLQAARTQYSALLLRPPSASFEALLTQAQQACSSSSGLLAAGSRLFSSHQAGPSPQQTERLKQALNAPPKSLFYDRGDVPIPKILDNALGKAVMTGLGFYSKKSALLHGGQALYIAIKEHVDSGALQKAFGMDPKVYFTTYTLLALHVWLVIHRMGHRSDPDIKFWRQRFYSQFQGDAEFRIYQAGIQVGVSRWTKKLENIFYSSGVGLDNVLRGQSNDSMADVILRDYFGNDPSHKETAQLIGRYLSRELACLAMTDDEAVLKGNVKFSSEPFKPWLPADGAEGKQQQGADRR